MEARELDLVVIGAGIYGIAASKFYLDAHPKCRLAVLEQDTCPGGSWSSSKTLEIWDLVCESGNDLLFSFFELGRLYPTFWSQIGLGMAEFSDLPMECPPETLHSLYEAKYVTGYLDKYVDEFEYEGRSLRDRMVFGFTVTKIEKQNGRWAVRGKCNEAKSTVVYHTPRIMIASGLTSTPNMPVFAKQERFKGLILHQRDFGQSSVLSSGDKHVTVLGGAKSAADMVYACAKAGKSVSWVIRRSGSGPAAFLGSQGRGPYKNSAELGVTRIVGTFTPSYFTPQTWWANFLHRTALGNWVVNQIWNTADKVSRDGADFDGRTNAQESFKKLKPSTIVFWSNDTLGLIQHPDFWETVAQNVHVYRDNVLELDGHIVRLQDGTEIPTDALLCGTGWTANSPGFFSRTELARLGLPHRVDQATEDDPLWTQLEAEADRRVLADFPRLAKPPDYYKKPTTTTPYRLYNCMVPLNDDSIVFLGHVHVPNAFRAAECQAIWATAHLDQKAKLPAMEEMQKDVALRIAWNRRRYLNNGRDGNYLHYDLVGYTDKLLGELGLSCRRKGWFADLFAPCKASDFEGPRKEYLEMVRGCQRT